MGCFNFPLYKSMETLSCHNNQYKNTIFIKTTNFQSPSQRIFNVFCRLLLPFRLHIFSHTVYFPVFYVYSPPADRSGGTGIQAILLGGRRSHIPLPPNEQPRLSLLHFYFFLFFQHFFVCFKYIYTIQNDKIPQPKDTTDEIWA